MYIKAHFRLGVGQLTNIKNTQLSGPLCLWQCFPSLVEKFKPSFQSFADIAVRAMGKLPPVDSVWEYLSKRKWMRITGVLTMIIQYIIKSLDLLANPYPKRLIQHLFNRDTNLKEWISSLCILMISQVSRTNWWWVGQTKYYLISRPLPQKLSN